MGPSRSHAYKESRETSNRKYLSKKAPVPRRRSQIIIFRLCLQIDGICPRAQNGNWIFYVRMCLFVNFTLHYNVKIYFQLLQDGCCYNHTTFTHVMPPRIKISGYYSEFPVIKTTMDYCCKDAWFQVNKHQHFLSGLPFLNNVGISHKSRNSNFGSTLLTGSFDSS